MEADLFQSVAHRPASGGEPQLVSTRSRTEDEGDDKKRSSEVI